MLLYQHSKARDGFMITIHHCQSSGQFFLPILTLCTLCMQKGVRRAIEMACCRVKLVARLSCLGSSVVEYSVNVSESSPFCLKDNLLGIWFNVALLCPSQVSESLSHTCCTLYVRMCKHAHKCHLFAFLASWYKQVIRTLSLTWSIFPLNYVDLSCSRCVGWRNN